MGNCTCGSEVCRTVVPNFSDCKLRDDLAVLNIRIRELKEFLELAGHFEANPKDYEHYEVLGNQLSAMQAYATCLERRLTLDPISTCGWTEDNYAL